MSTQAPASVPVDAVDRWWDRPFRMFQTNLREFDSGLDVDKVLDFIGEFGADTWLLNAGGIFSFYPTDLPFQTRNRYLERRPGGDLLGDAVERAHARGVRLVARMDFSKVTTRIAQEHPDWCYRSPRNELQEYSGLVSVCPSGPYYRERTLEILDEVLDRYAVDGFFFNWFGFNEVDYSKVYRGVCHCPSCRTEFSAKTGGQELPTGPESENYATWQRFAARQIDEVTALIRDHIAARQPDVGLILGHKADIIFHEANNAVGRDFWPLATDQSVSAIKAARPTAPVLVNSVSFVDMPYRLASEQPELFEQYLIQTISRGASPSTYIMGVPGDIPYLNVDVAARVTSFHQRHHKVYTGLLPASEVAIVRPASIGATAQVRRHARSEFEGVSLALTERHVPYDVLDQDDVPTVDLTRYRVVVFPDCGELPDDSLDAVSAWVHSGGHVIGTGRSAVTEDGEFQWLGSPAQKVTAELSGLADLAARYVVETYVEAEDRSGITAPVVPLHGSLLEVLWDEGASRIGLELGPARFGPPEKAWGNTPNGRPAFGRSTVGAGSVTVVPWTVGRIFRELGVTVARDYIVDRVIGSTGWRSSVRVNAPPQVAATLGRSSQGIVVHLNNLSGWRAQSMDKHVPIHGVNIDVDLPVTAARALTSDRSLSIRAHADGRRIDVPRVDAFEVVVLS